MVWPAMIPLKHVLGDDIAFIGGDGSERRAAGCCGVARRIDRRVGNTLQILIDFDPALRVPCDSGLGQIHVIYLRHAPGAMHRETGLKRASPLSIQT